METKQLIALAEVVLPTEILKYFAIVGVDSTPTEIYIHLDEKENPEMVKDAHVESQGFMEEAHVPDFPIRDQKVILKVGRRRWLDTRSGKSFSLQINLDVTAKGTRYSKEFGAFLKETYGDIPSDLPYA